VDRVTEPFEQVVVLLAAVVVVVVRGGEVEVVALDAAGETGVAAFPVEGVVGEDEGLAWAWSRRPRSATSCSSTWPVHCGLVFPPGRPCSSTWPATTTTSASLPPSTGRPSSCSTRLAGYGGQGGFGALIDRGGHDTYANVPGRADNTNITPTPKLRLLRRQRILTQASETRQLLESAPGWR
jgi:hypothetical protein